MTTTFANTPESTTLKLFIEKLDAVDVYADKAYASKEIDTMLEEKKVTNNICQKETKGMSQEAKQTHRENQKPISKIRAKVEHAIGTVKFEMKHAKARYIGLLRNHIDFVFLALASNLKTLAHRQQATKLCQIG